MAVASRAIPHSADYATTLLAVAACIESLSHRCLPVLDRLADLVAESLETLRPACEQLGEALATRDRFFFLGSGPSMATAQYGAAKFWEAAGLTGASPPFTTCLPLQLVCRKVATAKGHDVAEDTVRSVAPDLYGAVQRRWIR